MKKFYLLSLLVIFSLNLFSQTHWTKHPDPVMVNGSSGAWDANLDYIGSVIFTDNSYMMWYSAWSASDIEAVGLATSEDGITWTRDANNPVFEIGPEGSWDDTYVSCGDVTMVDDTLHMWYTGYTGNWSQSAIGHAYSIDGINWMRDPENPVLTVEIDGSLDNGYIWIDEVVFNGDHLHMWYKIGNMDIPQGYVRHATSIDGSQWTIDPSNPAILPGNPEDWDYPVVGFTGVVYDGSIFHMWYAGGNNNPSHIYDIGYATSTDGSNWDKYPGNPVMVKGPGSWDAASVFAPNVIDSAGSKYKMWYNGRPLGSGFNAKFGYAESSPYVEIPDTAFLYALIEEGVDTDGDSLISYKEAEVVTKIGVSGSSISNMSGIEAFINLEELSCWENQLTSLDVSNNTALKSLHCSGNQLSSLDVSKNISLTDLLCIDNQLTSLDLLKNKSLRTLFCYENQLTELDLSNNSGLAILRCSNNQLQNLNLMNDTALQILQANNNLLTTLNLSANKRLAGDMDSDVSIYAAYLGMSEDQRIELGGMPTLTEICVWEDFLLDSVEVYLEGTPNAYFNIECGANIVEIPDTAFLYALIEEGVDTDGDSLISYGEAETATSLDVSGENEDNRGNISDMLGIEAFINLDTLDCGYNQITSLDVSNNSLLVELHCNFNQLTSLDASNAINLEILSCVGNKLTSLDVSDNTSLKYLFCGNYGTFGYAGNQLTSIDISNNVALEALDISINQITSLDLSNNINLNWLNCADNHIINLDVSNNTALKYLHCGINELTNLDLSANTTLQYLTISSLPSLHEVCVWTTPFPPDTVHIDTTGSPNICFETDCDGMCEPTDVEELRNGDLSIYPNPTNTILTIETAISELYNIKITSLNGQLIQSKEFEGTAHQLDLSSFQKGVYFITIRSKDFVTTRKIVKL